MLEMSSEIIPDSIISFISAQFTQIPDVSIATGKPAKWRSELVGGNGNAPHRKSKCPYYRRAFPFWNDVPVLLLNHSNDTFAATNSFPKQFSTGNQSDLRVRKETITELLIGFCVKILCLKIIPARKKNRTYKQKIRTNQNHLRKK